tara:strand:- start:7683 stop:7919 length:237 start_codon:yes stop_codon:yes gene_type:complete
MNKLKFKVGDKVMQKGDVFKSPLTIKKITTHKRQCKSLSCTRKNKEITENVAIVKSSIGWMDTMYTLQSLEHYKEMKQ